VVGCSRAGHVEPAPTAADGGDAATGTAPRPSTAPNALTLPSASVEAVVNPENLPVYSGPTGSVEGTVSIQGDPSPEVPGLDFSLCPAAIDTYGKLFRAGPAGADGRRPLADAVVVLVGYSGFYLPEKGPAAQIAVNAKCAYATRTIAMTFGQRLEIANDSKFAFAPRLMGIFQPAVMIAPPGRNGDPVKLYPPKPGHYLLADTMQPYVHEDLFVLRQPLHAVSDLAGHYRIDDVPVGKLTVSAALPVIDRESHADVEVRANVVEHVDLALKYAAPEGGPPVSAHSPRPIP
jgi:hypothetical protein